jgi:flagellar protein FliS
MYQASAYNTYAKNNVEIESPQKLIKMLYEGILRFNTQAKRAMKEDDIERRAYWINRSISIFVELINNLDMSQGQVAQYLNALYQYQLNLLAKANLEKNELYLDEVNSVIRGLLEAWKEVTDVEQ